MLSKVKVLVCQDKRHTSKNYGKVEIPQYHSRVINLGTIWRLVVTLDVKLRINLDIRSKRVVTAEEGLHAFLTSMVGAGEWSQWRRSFRRA
jgi:hypothetical protein